MQTHHKRKKTIPPQIKGNQTGAEEKISASSEREAITLFAEAKQRLMNINQWKEYAGGFGADFMLTDPKGEPVSRIPQKGDYIRIDIPGPGTASGKGYDWVKLEAIEEFSDHNEDYFGYLVRPAANPASEGPDVTSSHFYTDDTTSSFVVWRRGKEVSAAEIGRNEIPNVRIGKITDKIRNVLVAFGAMLGLSVPQWKNLMKGIIHGKKS